MTALSPRSARARRGRGDARQPRRRAGVGRRALLGVPVVICVPLGNNPEKNAAMRGFGAELVEEGADYDSAVAVAERLQRERGLHAGALDQRSRR